MDFAHLVKFAIAASVLLMATSLGLRATLADATYLIRNLFQPPRSLLRALLAMNVVVPTVAVIVSEAFDLPQAVKVALLAMAVSPIPPILPGKQLKFGGRPAYVFGLLVGISLAAILLVPLGVELLGRIFGREAHLGFIPVAILIGKTVFLPLVLGLTVARFFPTIAGRLARILSRIGNVLLAAGLLPLFISVWPAVRTLVGNGTLIAIAAVVVTAIATGHLIGGPHPQDRTALGIFSAMRHPGVALSIATTNFPANGMVTGAILLFVLTATILTSIYGILRGHKLSSSPPANRATVGRQKAA
jgi:BASS family bile acid:Na+ symporter